jgi:hypothetical protein
MVQGPSMKNAEAVGAAPHLRDPRTLSVVVGNWKIGPTPHVTARDPFGDRKAEN